MNKTIEEAAKEYNAVANVTSENFCPEDITDAFGNGANHILSLPLAERLKEAERKFIRGVYSEATQWLKETESFENRNNHRRVAAVCIQNRLVEIFGSGFFKEET